MVPAVPRTFLQPHSSGRRQASSIYSGGEWRLGRLLYTPVPAFERLVEVLSTFQSSGRFGGVVRVLPTATASLLLVS